MRFLLDVNVGSTIAQALMEAGHDVVRAALSNATSPDGDLLSLAVDGRRILVTYDRDFSNLIFGAGAERPPAVIYLRSTADDLETTLSRLMPLLDFDQLSGHITVIGKQRVRRRPYPSDMNDNA